MAAARPWAPTQVLRSGFETGRRVDELRAGEVGADAVDHAAAEHQRLHLPQVLRADVEHADAIRPEDFMTGKGQEVAAERLDVYGSDGARLERYRPRWGCWRRGRARRFAALAAAGR